MALRRSTWTSPGTEAGIEREGGKGGEEEEEEEEEGEEGGERVHAIPSILLLVLVVVVEEEEEEGEESVLSTRLWARESTARTTTNGSSRTMIER